jgi:hypothetical protein
MPGHTVPAITVVTQAGGSKRLAQLGEVMTVQSVPRLSEHRIGEQGIFAVPTQESRHVDDTLVHHPALGVPRHGLDETEEQLVGSRDPSGQVVDPGAASELGAAKRSEVPDCWPGIQCPIEQRPLKVRRHGQIVSAIERMF